MMLETIDYLNGMDIQGIKLQLLHILKGTDLARDYEARPFWSPTMEEYIELLGSCVARLRPDITIHRLTGDGPKELLIAPLWTSQKRTVLNTFSSAKAEEQSPQDKSPNRSKLLFIIILYVLYYIKRAAKKEAAIY